VSRSTRAQSLNTVSNVIALAWSNIDVSLRYRLLLTIVLVVFSSTCTALGPIALKLVVDQFTGNGARGSWSPFALIALYVVSQFMARAVSETRGLVFNLAERRIFRILTERLFAHIMRLPMRFHLNRQTGAIAQVLNNGIHGYNLVLQHMVFTLMPVLIELCTVIVVLVEFHRPLLLVLFCVGIAAYATAFSVFAVRIAGAARTASDSDVEVGAVMTDAILNYETVKYFDAEAEVEKKLGSAIVRNESEWIRFFRRYAQNGLGVAAIYGVFISSIAIFAAREVQLARMTVGDFVLVMTYMVQVSRPIEMLGQGMQAFSQGTAMLQKMLELFEQATEQGVLRGDRGSSEGSGSLQFEHVSFSYGPDRRVLTDLSFDLPAGKTLAIVGASGAGKSSIVRLLVRLLEPDSGRIILDGVPTSQLSLSQLRQAIAVVPQDTALFDDTIAKNIAFGSAGCSQKDIEQAARLAHLHDLIMTFPEGYETRVGERGMRLSGGERQRVSIARAALRRPRIYVLDEATSSLDSATEQEILDNFREITQATTNVVIAHRLSTVAHADEIIVLNGGAVVERGSHASLLKSAGYYATLWSCQHRRFRSDLLATDEID
jgi:ABC-type transport system involved in Fe-S cluster assembly fused permease/ATPase subunit